MSNNPDFLIIGAGIVGLAIAKAIKARDASASIIVIDKEVQLGAHASGRNSGVLHAGFYYSGDSLKARFCVEGNKSLKEFCREQELPLLECGKLVVAKNERENLALDELARRGEKNGVKLELVSEQDALEIDPNVKTHERALWSPNTASGSPGKVIERLAEVLKTQGVEISLGEAYTSRSGDTVKTAKRSITPGFTINAAGLYADKIAYQFGFGKDYCLLPFKGLYLKYKGTDKPIRTHIYPVPDLKLPFLGVHFTLTVDGTVKIGPTATPALWREQYGLFESFKLSELVEVLSWESFLFLSNSFHFRDLAFTEVPKYWKPHFVRLSKELVRDIDAAKFTDWAKPGIRAQLLNKRTKELVQDFLVESDENSLHVLNAVSPAWTCSFPFGEHCCELIPSLN